jgi:hypothetical protein
VRFRLPRLPFLELESAKCGLGNHFTGIGILVFALELSQILVAGGVIPDSQLQVTDDLRELRRTQSLSSFSIWLLALHLLAQATPLYSEFCCGGCPPVVSARTAGASRRFGHSPRAVRVSLVRQLDRHTGRLVAADTVRSSPLDLRWGRSLGWAKVGGWGGRG